MAASQSGVFSLQEFSDIGAPLVGGRLYTYVYGTTTHKTAYTDKAGTIPHTYTSDGIGGQYIALNARGELPAPLYLAAGSYDITLKDSTGATIWTRRADPVDDSAAALDSAIRSDLASTSDVGKGSGMVGFIQSGAGAVARTAQSKLREFVSVKDFGAVGDGDTDDTAAIQLAINAVSPTRGQLTLAGGRYLISSPLQVKNFTDINGEGGTLIVNADCSAIDNPSGSASLYVKIHNLRIASKVANTSSAIYWRDISRSVLSNVLIDRETGGTNFAFALRVRSDTSVSYWNKFYNFECTNVSNTFISIENGANDNFFYGMSLINGSTVNPAYGLRISSGSGNRFFGLTLESAMGVAGVTTGQFIQFDSGAVHNSVYGTRTEAFPGGGTVYGINWNVGTNNSIFGHYPGGLTDVSIGDMSGNTYIPGSDAISAPEFVAGVKDAADGQYKLARKSDGSVLGLIEWISASDRLRHNNANGGMHAFDINDTNYFNVASSGVQLVNHTTTPSAGSLAGYVQVVINGITRKIPYYDV